MKNRKFLLSILDVIICLGQRNVAFRGSWEEESEKESDAATITEAILRQLTEMGLQASFLRGQGYDGGLYNERATTAAQKAALQEQCTAAEHSRTRAAGIPSDVRHQKATDLAKSVDVVPTKRRISVKQSYRASIPTESVEDHYRVNLFYPFIDHIISELDGRFAERNEPAMLAAYLVQQIWKSSLTKGRQSSFSGTTKTCLMLGLYKSSNAGGINLNPATMRLCQSQHWKL
ncbi:hypothetical protein SKAU_G00243990 [Synaphobranchus kaupii]|uniref:Uncharacterized protein n=1 Tax=Synaphobranchus kaupii TaxID=118154 RepID=A0A9Q1F1J1_SYNKA|nr:hypothetical protein SKAU_G00243990 [Synaphobranchus kaupii]